MVGIHRDNNGNDHADVVLRALVEFFCKYGDGNTVLTERGADRRLGSRLAGRDLQLDIAYNFLCHDSIHLRNVVKNFREQSPSHKPAQRHGPSALFQRRSFVNRSFVERLDLIRVQFNLRLSAEQRGGDVDLLFVLRNGIDDAR